MEVVQNYESGLEREPSLHDDPESKYTAPHTTPPIQPPFPANTVIGLRRSTFLLVFALAVVIIAAAVGGGVGGSMAVSKAKRDCLNGAGASPTHVSSGNNTGSASPSASNPSYLTLPSTTIAWGLPTPSVALPDCSRGTYSTILAPESFAIHCNSDNPGGDILWIVTSDLYLCIEACGAWNSQPGGSNNSVSTPCQGVLWFPSWSNGRTDGFETYNGSPVNCILKNNMDGLAYSNISYAAVRQ